MNQGRKLVMSYTAKTVKGDGWELRLGDACQEVKKIESDSIDMCIHSPPFSNLYIYSDSAFDMGNASDDEEFFKHYKFLIPELLRVTVPGRLCAVHCKDLPLYRNRDDASGLQDFPAEISRAFTEAGWVFHSRVTIWKCPVTERERTNSHGLLHKTAMEDCTRVRQGMADYLLVFRKNPVEGTKSVKPVVRPHGFTAWPGDPDLDPRKNSDHPSKFARKPGKKPRMIPAVAGDAPEVDLTPSVNIWQRLADPVWFHINQREVLNYKSGTAENDEKHICPLQLGVVREAVYLWTNPGDLVFSPFAGVGSEGYESLLLGRRFLGIELKQSYLDVASANLTRATEKVKKNKQPDLFTEVA
jgi:DNA modification methylase